MGWLARVLAVLVGVGTLAVCTQHPDLHRLHRGSPPSAV
jgi:hypothetical protein